MEAIQTENKTAESIQQLFKSSDCVRIPAYQRAYSWGDKQCSQFLEDLLEQKGKKYYLGQFLFEKDGNVIGVYSVTSRRPETLKKITIAVMVVSVRIVESAAAVP